MKKRIGRMIIACALAFVLMIGVLPTQALILRPFRFFIGTSYAFRLSPVFMEII